VTRAELMDWLESRRPEAPPTLQAQLRGYLTDRPESLAEHLAVLGRELLARVLARPDGGRELARDLLAADALVTYAFEAQAERDPWGLTALAQRVSGGDA
jgi:hypothetical protein